VINIDVKHCLYLFYYITVLIIKKLLDNFLVKVLSETLSNAYLKFLFKSCR